MDANIDIVRLPVRNETLSKAEIECITLISHAHNAKVEVRPIASQQGAPHANIIGFLAEVVTALNGGSGGSVATALAEVISQCTLDTDFGGYGLRQDVDLTGQQEADVVFLCSAYLEALKAETRTHSAPSPLHSRPAGRRGMTMTEKIFAAHDTSRRGWVRPGDVVQVDVDWVLASELSHAVSFEPFSLRNVSR